MIYRMSSSLYTWYLYPLSLVYRTLCPCSFDPPPHGISNPLPMVYPTLSYGIMNRLPMIYRTPYLWYIEPPTHCILTSLPMVYRAPYQWYIEPPRLVGMRGFNLPWYDSKYNDQNLTPGSKYHMVYWTRGRFLRGSKYHMTPVYSRVRFAQSSFLCNVL